MPEKITLEKSGIKEFLGKIDKSKEIEEIKGLTIKPANTLKKIKGDIDKGMFDFGKTLSANIKNTNKYISEYHKDCSLKNAALQKAVNDARKKIFDPKLKTGWKAAVYLSKHDSLENVGIGSKKIDYTEKLKELKTTISGAGSDDDKIKFKNDPRSDFFKKMKEAIAGEVGSLNFTEKLEDHIATKMKESFKSNGLERKFNNITDILIDPSTFYKNKVTVKYKGRENEEKLKKACYAMQEGYQKIQEDFKTTVQKPIIDAFDKAIDIAKKYSTLMDAQKQNIEKLGDYYTGYIARLKSNKHAKHKKETNTAQSES